MGGPPSMQRSFFAPYSCMVARCEPRHISPSAVRQLYGFRGIVSMTNRRDTNAHLRPNGVLMYRVLMSHG
eukprot:4080796-Prymnesium_polylepis.1